MPTLIEPLVRLENLLEQFTGKRPAPAPARAWDAFFALPETKREEIITSWSSQADFIQGAIDRGIDHCDERGMLNYALGTMNLLADTGLFSMIEDSDVFEIMSPDFVQVYRSFSYFALCNYSLVELASYPFFELYERSSWVMEQLLKYGSPVLEGKTNIALMDQIPEYTIREVMTETGCLYSMKERAVVRLVSSLTGQNYILSVKRVKALATPASAESKSNLAFL